MNKINTHISGAKKLCRNTEVVMTNYVRMYAYVGLLSYYVFEINTFSMAISIITIVQ